MQLCAITAYFNPLNFEAPRKNYELFEARLLEAGVPLYVVECQIEGAESAPLLCHANLIRTRGRDFIWHRERLINLALPRVPKNFDAVAWVDADILFLNPDWRAEAEERLRDFPVVQLFEKVTRLPPGQISFDAGGGDRFPGMAKACTENRGALHLGRLQHGHTGFAWAFRRDCLEQFKLYEGDPVGGADHVMAHTFFGDLDSHCIRDRFSRNPSAHRHFREWAERTDKVTHGRVGYVSGEILHLWHGHPVNRRYLERWDEVQALGFDPYRDINYDGEVLAWADDRRDLAEWARSHWESRREDDRSAELDRILFRY